MLINNNISIIFTYNTPFIANFNFLLSLTSKSSIY